MRQTHIFRGNNEVTMARTSWVTCRLEDTFRQAFRGLNSLVLYDLVRRITHGTVIRTTGALVFCGGLFA
jgi:hypothetical protein